MRMISIFTFLGISLLIQLLLFLPAFIFKTDKLTDLSYGITFIILAIVSLLYNQSSTVKIILTSMVVIWALRLIVYLFIRINAMKKDDRFDTVRNNFLRFGAFWLGQGVIVWLVLLPTFLFNNTSANNIGLLQIIGIAIFLAGLVIETIADLQKFKFKQNKNNKGKFIKEGVWKYSRHPNYFGEMLVWIGIYVYAISALTLTSSIIALAGPLTIIIILRYITGIPTLEKKYNKRYKDNKEYQKYKKETNLLIPIPKR